MNKNFHCGRRIIIYFANLYFAFIAGFDNRFNQFGGVGPKWNLGNCKCFIVYFTNFSTNLYCTTTLSIIVTTHIDRASGLKIGEKDKFLVAQMSNAGVE